MQLVNSPMSLPMSLLASAPDHGAPSSTVTLWFGLLLVAMIAALALEEKIHAKKSLIVGCFAAISLLAATALHLLPFGPIVVGGHSINLPVFIPAIDWGVICIILGSSLFVDASAKSGIFSWTAIKLTKMSGGNPRRLLWYYGAMTVVFSAVLNNVTAMIIVGSLTGVSLRKLGKDDYLLGFLLVEGLLTNIGGLLTLISSIPNIIVGTAAGISFVEFFVKAAPFVLVCTALTIAMGLRIFDIQAPSDDAQRARALELVEAFEESEGISSPAYFKFAAAMTALFIVTIATTSVLPWVSDLGMGYVALTFAAVMLIRYRHEVDALYREVDWDLLGFFAALFVVINVMEHALVLEAIGVVLAKMLELGDNLGTGLLLISAAVASSVTDNIPLAAMLAKILTGLSISSDSPLWWSVVFGANLGGNLTPIGSASTLVAVTVIHRYGLSLSFAGFVVKALPFAALHLAMAAAYVLLFLA